MTKDQSLHTTTDQLFQVRPKIRQKQKGYRFSTDTVILAHHICLEHGECAVDLGTGCGIIPIIVARRFPSAILYGIEIQEDLAKLALSNVALNHMEDRVFIVHGDMKDFTSYFKVGMADVVFSNPPYRKVYSGRISPDAERAIARHEIHANLFDVIYAAQKLLKPLGRLVVIYPAQRSVDLIVQMRALKLEPKKLRLIHSKYDSEAKLILVEARKDGNPGGVSFMPTLIVHNRDGSFTEEVREMMVCNPSIVGQQAQS
ncbi:MAG: tRNA1(Val) (adenine(37)-N6)-methyltransferase [Deltaproteobacteria bacterium]|nr:tRNA1(Val) (adenine(37)-N6)-methyltransferase [Deltaproteobacteria bacterium]